MSQPPPSAEAPPVPAEDSIKVVCRFRPLNKTELATGSKYVPKFKDDNCVSVSGKSYIFDRVFDSNTTQPIFYEGAAKAIVKDVLSGFNGTIFAYGQTSSGKTHTMEGVIGDPNLQGIIPRIVQDIFNHIYAGDENLVFHLKCSYFEIYLDKITDLLDVTKVNLSVHEDKNRVPFVKGATERFVSSPEEVFAVIDEGKSNRHITATNMNAESSRSHSIFLIDINQEHAENQKKLSGKLYLVDLAGSEKISKTGAEGVVLDEAKNINKSLSALGNVISSLADGVKSHIPYRDSKLTRILQESLGGNARTTIIICCSPASFNEAETKSTLDFGRRAKTIKNAVRVNEELTAEEWKRRYSKEKEKVKLLRNKLKGAEKELEKWRQGETVSAEEQISLEDESAAPPPTETTTFPPSQSQVSPSVTVNVESSTEYMRLEQKVELLYQQLDEKDEEVTQQCILVESLKDQLAGQEELITASRKDYEMLQQEMARVEAEGEAATDEVQEVLQALEELALSYDQKVTEVEEKVREIDRINGEFAGKQTQLNLSMSELGQSRDQNKQTNEMFINFVQDLNEIELALGISPLVDLEENDFSSVGLLMGRISIEVRNLLLRCETLEASHSDCNKKMDDYENLLAVSRTKNAEIETQAISAQETAKNLESQKNYLKEQIYALTQGQSLGSTDQAVRKNVELLKNQLQTLQDEIDAKSTLVDQLRDMNQQLMSKQKYLEEDVERWKSGGGPQCNLQQVVLAQSKQKEAKGELNELQEKVSKELQTLLNLRRMFVSNMKSRMHRDHGVNESDNDGGSLAQKKNIALLEENLEHLTKNYKMLIRDNSDLKCGILRVEKRLQVTRERVKTLESALRAAREKCVRDRKLYQQHVDRIRGEAVCRKWKNVTGRRMSQAQIAKPVRSGQPA